MTIRETIENYLKQNQTNNAVRALTVEVEDLIAANEAQPKDETARALFQPRKESEAMTEAIRKHRDAVFTERFDQLEEILGGVEHTVRNATKASTPEPVVRTVVVKPTAEAVMWGIAVGAASVVAVSSYFQLPPVPWPF